MKLIEIKQEDNRGVEDDELTTVYTDWRGFDQLALLKSMNGSGDVANDRFAKEGARR